MSTYDKQSISRSTAEPHRLVYSEVGGNRMTMPAVRSSYGAESPLCALPAGGYTTMAYNTATTGYNVTPASSSPYQGTYSSGGHAATTTHMASRTETGKNPSFTSYGIHRQSTSMMSPTIVSQSSRVDHSQTRVIAERVVEHEVRVPKKITREDVVEKVIIVPEKIVHEEVVEDVQTIREKIIEVACPIIQEKIVEIPEIEYVERIVEVPEIVVKEKIREVPRVQIKERIVEVPRIVTQERIVEVPEIEYREIPYEKVVEIPEIREQIVVKEVPVPQYVDKPVPEYVDVTEEREIVRVIPVAVEAVTTCEFKLPRLRPKYTAIDVPLYVPRFVEVPIPLDSMDAVTVAQAESYSQQVAMMASQTAVSLCEVESLAHNIKATDFDQLVGAQDQAASVADNWMSGRLQVDSTSMSYATSATPVENIVVTETVHVGAPIVGEISQAAFEQARSAVITQTTTTVECTSSTNVEVPVVVEGQATPAVDMAVEAVA